MVFSTNQTRQLYVVNSAETTKVTAASAKGAISAHKTVDNDLFFLYKGADNLMRSDMIDIKNIISVKATNASEMAPKLKAYEVALATGVTIESGEDYLLRINFKQWLSLGEEHTYMKYGVVHGTEGMNASTFYKKMALSLAKNFSREVIDTVKFSLMAATAKTEVTATTKESALTGTYTGILIEELEQPWELGIKAYKPLNFEITFSTVNVEGEEVAWGETKVTTNSVILNNGKIIADLEYFCMGERADQYRMIGYPNYIKTTYLVDPTKAYHTLDIHYAYVGSNESVQKSEKTITLVCTSDSELDEIITTINSLTGLSVAKLGN